REGRSHATISCRPRRRWLTSLACCALMPLACMAGQGETKYAKSGGVNIAYQVVGEGHIDLVFIPGWVSHIESAGEEPSLAPFFERMASFSRLILLDRRGTGLSDPVDRLPTLEERVDDVRAVMDAAGSARAFLFGISESGPMCVLL